MWIARVTLFRNGMILPMKPVTNRLVRRKSLMALALALVSAQLIAATSREWKSGMLLSVDEPDLLTSTKKQAVVPVRLWAYSIDAGDVVYEAERRSKRPIQIEISGPVSFALDGAHLYVKDATGHEFKLTLLKTTRKKGSE